MSEESALLEKVIHKTGFLVGEQFLEHCLMAFCQTFDMDFAFVAKLNQNNINKEAYSISFYSLAKGLLPNFSYPLIDTPCWEIYQNSDTVCIPNRVQQAYPKDSDLVDLNAESYLGVPIVDQHGKAFGHIALLSSKGITEPTRFEKLFFKIFASRTGAEIHRLETQKQLLNAKQRAEGANKAKTQFLANMSHELRTPLNAVLGYAQLLGQSESLSKTEREQVTNVSRNGNHLLSLITDILDMSSIELNEIKVRTGKLVLSELHNDIQTMFCPIANGTELGCSMTFEPNLPAIILADKDKLRQIIVNLITNAFKYAKGSEVRYLAKATSETKERPRELEITVSDTGPGIALADQVNLFEPFERVNPDQANIPGSGLGLAIAHRYAQAMGGDLIVESDLGKGCIFKLSLPLIELDQPESEQNAQAQSSTRPLSGKVLIVDDNEDSRFIVHRILSLESLEVIEAQDGEEGVEACLNQRPDLVLMDVRMPRLSGPEAAQKIRAQLGEKCPPIIGLTGDLLNVKGTPMQHETFDAIIGKPFEFATLIDLVKKHLTPSN